ncbi:PRC-barrel domain-containing protein [Salipaludibacillus agaradhaerens]|uniref:PRC-barrel domain-containing protein n=1 Tax=Salipaludibacillus agaradhaerens TaxID=76935 RepID=UPI002151618E|nr:PRC-barrel domain-containing protein [Salipaludibacillus agaradhaerens]MCR6106217.1 PRC-barrel domain-containing protein [Salipaludibacillus agaradhaerens]MCR6118250.1 PRC-barrel domain-containing protein [Salipaludibacillus agaradhaerens]
MRTFEKVKGAPVFHGQKRRLLGKIADLAYNESTGHISGYLIQRRNWWAKNTFLPLSATFTRSQSSFILHESQQLLPMNDSDRRVFHGTDRLTGRAVYNEEEDIIGIVEDVYFLPNSGRILGYELTEGLFEDIQRGFFVKKTGDMTVTKHGQELLLHN